MAPEKKEVFISHSRGWADARQIPIMAWMERYAVEAFNNPAVFSNKSEMAKWHTADWTHVHSDGTKYEGFDAGFEAIQQIFAPFTEGFSHEPRFWACWENEDGGWEMIGEAFVYANLPRGGYGEGVLADMSGKKWDLAAPGMFHIWFVKDADGPDGIKVKRSDAFWDTFPAVQEMTKRGLFKT
jgi:hypothetical protein